MTGRYGHEGGISFYGERYGDGGSGVKGKVENTIIVQTEQFYKLQRTVVDKGVERGRGG